MVSLFGLGYFLYVAHAFRTYVSPYYLYPIVPSLYYGAAKFWMTLFEAAGRRLQTKPSHRRAFHAATAVFLLAVHAGPFTKAVGDFRAHAGWQKHPRVLAGRFLEETYPPNTRIAHVFFAWVPVSFANVFYYEHKKERRMIAFRPDLVVTNEEEARFSEGFVKGIRRGTYPFREAHRIGPYVIYKRAGRSNE